jgi:small-conductance mechanosensitive channel/CRP-like cAMP-binding protein
MIGRIWTPLLAVVAFAALALLGPELHQAMDGRVGSRLADTIAYGAQIGLWLAGAWLAIQVVNIALAKGFTGRAVPRLIRDLLAIVILVVAAAGIIGGVFGQSIAGIWATSGALGIVLGFALRGIILDTFTGLFINIDHAYRIGDWVELFDRGNDGRIYGKVVEIDWRTTRIEGDDKRLYIVPNSRMGTITIANYSQPDEICRFEFGVTLDASIDPERAMRIMLAGAKAACDGRRIVETPAPSAIVGSATPLGIEYRIRYWAAVSQIPVNVARHTVTNSVLKHLRRAGIAPAVPKQDNFLARMPERQLPHLSEADRTRLLGAVDIFAELTPEELHQLAVAMTPRLVPAGATVMTEGGEGASMVVLAEGLLEVAVQQAGARIRLARLEPGEFAGEMSLLTGEPRTATISAATEALVYEVTRDHLMPILASRPALFEAISQIAARRRLTSADTLGRAATTAEHPEMRGMSSQILSRMRLFFRTIGQRPADERAKR